MLSNGITAIEGLSGTVPGRWSGAGAVTPGAVSAGQCQTWIWREMFLNRHHPPSRKSKPSRLPTLSRAAPDIARPPGWLASCKRAATLTPSP